MNKAYMFLLGCITIAFVSCNSSKENKGEKTTETVSKAEKSILGEPKDLEVNTLSNYFLKNTVALPDATNYFVISDTEALESKLGVAKTTTNTVEAVDFSKNSVAVIALKPTNKKTTIIIKSVKQIGTGIRVDYAVVSGEETTHSTTPIELVKLPKNAAVQSVSFQTGNKVVKTIDLK